MADQMLLDFKNAHTAPVMRCWTRKLTKLPEIKKYHNQYDIYIYVFVGAFVCIYKYQAI